LIGLEVPRVRFFTALKNVHRERFSAACEAPGISNGAFAGFDVSEVASEVAERRQRVTSASGSG